MKWGDFSLKNSFKNFKIRVINIGISTETDEYQRMLSGTRIYLSFMSQRKFVNLIFYTFITFFVLTGVFSGISLLSGEKIQILFLIFMASFYPIFVIGLSLFTIYKENDFSFITGFLLYIKNKTTIFFMTMMIIFCIAIFLIPGIIYNLNYFLTSFMVIIILLSSALFSQLVGEIKSSSYIRYALNRLNKIISMSEDIKTEKTRLSNYKQYYYAIYCYYKIERDRITNVYENDVISLTKFDKLPILASQIIYNDDKKRKDLKKILLELENIKPIKDCKKFKEIIENIQKEFAPSLLNNEGELDTKEIFKRKIFTDTVKKHLIYLIPITTAVITIIKVMYDMFL